MPVAFEIELNMESMEMIPRLRAFYTHFPRASARLCLAGYVVTVLFTGKNAHVIPSSFLVEEPIYVS